MKKRNRQSEEKAPSAGSRAAMVAAALVTVGSAGAAIADEPTTERPAEVVEGAEEGREAPEESETMPTDGSGEGEEGAELNGPGDLMPDPLGPVALYGVMDPDGFPGGGR